MPQSITILSMNPVITTDATPTQILLPSVPDDSVVFADIYVTAFAPSTGEAAGYHAKIFGKRVTTGNLTLIGSVIADTPQEDVAAWAVSFSTSGTTPAITVTGQAAKTIKWNTFGFMGIPH